MSVNLSPMSTNQVSTSPALSFSSAVSPEQLLALLSSRMRDLDGQLSGIMTKINADTARATELSEKLQALEAVNQTIKKSDKGKAIDADATTRANFYSSAQKTLSEDMVQWQGKSQPAIQVLQQYGLQDVVGKDGKVHAEALDSKMQSLRQQLSDANKGNEMTMIQLQSLIQQRSEALQNATSMMKGAHDMKMEILRNLR